VRISACIPDPQLELQLEEQPFKPARMPTGFHPHPHFHSLPRQFAVKLLRFLRVLQSPFLRFPSVGLHKSNVIFQYLQWLLNCRRKPVWVLLDNDPLADLPPTLFGFASQCVTSKLHLFRFTILKLVSVRLPPVRSVKKEDRCQYGKQLSSQNAFPTPKACCSKHLRILIRLGVGEATG
jgi:hypothetical protein